MSNLNLTNLNKVGAVTVGSSSTSSKPVDISKISDNRRSLGISLAGVSHSLTDSVNHNLAHKSSIKSLVTALGTLGAGTGLFLSLMLKK